MTDKRGEIIIYKTQNLPEIKVNFIDDTIWLNQAQMAELFGKNIPTINYHIKNIYRTAELSQKRTIRKFRVVQTEGKRKIERWVDFYNLDMVISVGYRVNSKRGTQFRIWATQKLREYLLKSIPLNRKSSEEIAFNDLGGTVGLVRQTIESPRSAGHERDLLKIITDYTDTWLVLNQYDLGKLKISGVVKKKTIYLDYENIKKVIEQFKLRLMNAGEASDLFGSEINNKLSQLLGSVKQSFDGVDLYPSVEEKAAHLFYFVIKDHPFVDGNKRIGSLLFILFMIGNNILMNIKGEQKINDSALAALALLVAESKPPQKDVMIKLIVNLINKK